VTVFQGLHFYDDNLVPCIESISSIRLLNQALLLANTSYYSSMKIMKYDGLCGMYVSTLRTSSAICV
jgi:hypothetical protein